MRVLVAGGGIGGLATAVALRRVGIDVLVMERAPEIHEVGAGLSLWANAVKVLQRLGLEQQIVTAGSVVNRAVTRAASGETISEMDLGLFERAAGAPSVCAHRADLQRILANAAPIETVWTGAACVSFTQDTDGVRVLLEDGRTVDGDFLVGADGIHSTTRRQLIGAQEPRYAGYVGLRAVAQIPCPLTPGELLFVTGRGVQVGVLPCGEARTYWFVTRNAPAGTRWAKAELVKTFRDWPSVVRDLVAATNESVILQGDIIDRPPVKTWGQGRVTLLGDAVHPTTPNLGQGACQAIESAEALADCMERIGTVEAALRAYEQLRQARTAMVTTRSWSLGRMLQWENPALAWARDKISRTALGQQHGAKMFEELLVRKGR